MKAQTASLPESTGVVLRPGVWLAFGLLGLSLLLPLPVGLTPQGRSALVLLGLSLALWLTEAVSYEVSAILIAGFTALVLGLTADPASPQGAILGTTKALGAALQGFANPALALLAGPLFIAAAMTVTGLDRRIALFVLTRLGFGARGILAGVILVSAVLSFVVPSAPGRMAALVPITLGVLAAVGLERRSRFGGLLMIAAADAASIWNIGVKTAGPQNIVGLGFMEADLGLGVTWPQWFAIAGPYAAIMSVVLYGLLLWLNPDEFGAIPGGREQIRQALTGMGPMTQAEKRLAALLLITLALWATEKLLHPLDASTVTVAAIAVLLLPRIGVITWREAQARVAWGTIVLLGVAISLGTVLLRSGAAAWLADKTFGAVGLGGMTPPLMLAAITAFTTAVHLGFASATALTAALIPMVIGFLRGLSLPPGTVWWLVLVTQFSVSFGFVLPVNAPQNMVAYATETFSSRDFIRIGLPLTGAAYLVMLLFAATYWRWLGLG